MEHDLAGSTQPGRRRDIVTLRVGNLRVLYRVEEEEGTIRVIVALIGRKDRNELIVEGEVFEL